MNFSENYSYINPYIGGSNKEPPKDPWGLLESTGRRFFGDLFFPLMPLDVIRPNTSCSRLSLQEESVSICLIFDPLKWLIGARRLCLLIAHSEQLLPPTDAAVLRGKTQRVEIRASSGPRRRWPRCVLPLRRASDRSEKVSKCSQRSAIS